MDMGQLEQQADRGSGPLDAVRLKVLGPRANGASSVKAFFYLSLACIGLAINSQCNSREWAAYAKSNYQPNYIYLDPTGAAYLVEMPRSTEVVANEDNIRFWIWAVTKFQYEAKGDTAAEESKSLVDYYFDGEAMRVFGHNSDDANVLGSSAEKAQLIATGRYRELELRSLFLKNFTTLSDGAQKVSAELMFFARTYTRGLAEPELRRAFRVRYEFTIMSPLKRGLKLREQRDFLRDNPLRLRVQSYQLQEENPGSGIPPIAENQGPNPGAQSQALTPTGSTPAVPVALVGGPTAPLAPSRLLSPQGSTPSTSEPRR